LAVEPSWEDKQETLPWQEWRERGELEKYSAAEWKKMGKQEFAQSW
jgi:hypothetical protein